MSIVKRGNSPFWYMQFQMNGRTYIRSSRTTNRKAAEQMENEWRVRLHAQQFLGQRDRISVESALRQYLLTKESSPSIRLMRTHCKVICRQLPARKPLDELTLHDLERFVRDRMADGKASQTIKHSINLIRCAWKHAKKLGYQVSELDFPVIKLPKYRLRYLTSSEEQRLLHELDPTREGKGLRTFAERDGRTLQAMQDAYDLVVLLLDTGARYSEIAKLGWKQVDLTTREIHLWRPKVQNEAVLYMSNRAFDVLRRRSESPRGDWVFESRSGGPRGYASQSIRKAFRRAGLTDCRIHTLRHTHASRLIQHGMSIYEVREILGHTDIKTTMRYAHLERRDVSSRARDVINRINQRDHASV